MRPLLFFTDYCLILSFSSSRRDILWAWPFYFALHSYINLSIHWFPIHTWWSFIVEVFFVTKFFPLNFPGTTLIVVLVLYVALYHPQVSAKTSNNLYNPHIQSHRFLAGWSWIWDTCLWNNQVLFLYTPAYHLDFRYDIVLRIILQWAA